MNRRAFTPVFSTAYVRTASETATICHKRTISIIRSHATGAKAHLLWGQRIQRVFIARDLRGRRGHARSGAGDAFSRQGGRHDGLCDV